MLQKRTVVLHLQILRTRNPSRRFRKDGQRRSDLSCLPYQQAMERPEVRVCGKWTQPFYEEPGGGLLASPRNMIIKQVVASHRNNLTPSTTSDRGEAKDTG